MFSLFIEIIEFEEEISGCLQGSIHVHACTFFFKSIILPRSTTLINGALYKGERGDLLTIKNYSPTVEGVEGKILLFCVLIVVTSNFFR